ncbi:MAG TPA: 30S ribosomal protein S16 [Candidatus Polarisedimenticolia bacterium]|nr:30S ribosomal protein S16 [Candidatus Polarisedimenticolia bacterium]
MVLAIRLFRAGSKNRPFYRIVVSESARTPGSRVTAQLGVYDPTKNPEVLKLDVAKAEEWIRKGAHASDTVRSILERARTAQASA